MIKDGDAVETLSSRALPFSSSLVPFAKVSKVITCRTLYQMTEHSKMYQNTPAD